MLRARETAGVCVSAPGVSRDRADSVCGNSRRAVPIKRSVRGRDDRNIDLFKLILNGL